VKLHHDTKIDIMRLPTGNSEEPAGISAESRSETISMKVVVTGGSGFIGSSLAGELVKSRDVTAIDNLSTGRIENLDCIRDRVELIQGSILDLLSGSLPELAGSFTWRPLHRCRGQWTIPPPPARPMWRAHLG